MLVGAPKTGKSPLTGIIETSAKYPIATMIAAPIIIPNMVPFFGMLLVFCLFFATELKIR